MASASTQIDLAVLADLPAAVARLQAKVAELEAKLASPAPPEDLLDVAGAAKLLGMTEGAVRSAAYRGSLPVVRVGSRLRFRPSDLVHCRT
jgi:excisionase family DNA binding protein